MRRSAGTLLYRHTAAGLEILLIHPSGNYNRNAPWSIPKGEPDGDETLEATARRETEEETGIRPEALTDLGFVDYRKSRKRIFAFAGPAPSDAQPWCASWEVDRAEFLTVERALHVLHPAQKEFVHRLLANLGRPLG